MFSSAHGDFLCLFLFWLLPGSKWRRINVSRWPFVLHERKGKCSFSTDLREPSCSSFQSSNYRQPSQTSTLQNTEIKQLFTQGSSWAQTGTFLLIPRKSLDHCLGWLVDSVFPCGMDDAPKCSCTKGAWLRYLVPFYYLLIRVLVERDLLSSKEREGTCFVLWHLSPLEIYCFISLLPILFFSSINAFITYCNNSCHPLFLFVLVFIPLIWD